MVSENVKDFDQLMSEELKRKTNNMVFEGVTPKSDMKKVKAMKKLWRSDSFQALKSILEEPPIQEGRTRQMTVALKDEDDDEIPETEASPRDTPQEKEKKEKEIEFCKRKEELTAHYQNCLIEDLEKLQEKADTVNEILFQKAWGSIEESEVEQLEDAVKLKIIDMQNSIKYYKKNRNSIMKLAMEEDRKVVTKELDDYIAKEMEVRTQMYRQLLQKVNNYKMKVLEETLFEEYENKIRQEIRLSIIKFDYAKNKLLEQQAKDLETLDCRLMAEYAEYAKWSDNRVQSMVEDATNELAYKKVPDVVAVEESQFSLLMRSISHLKDKLPWEPVYDENWENIVEELLKRYQFFVELVYKDKRTKQHEYLLSIDKLKSFKDRIAKITNQKLNETKEIRKRKNLRSLAKIRAASILDNLMRNVLPSPLLSRYSISDLNFNPKGICKPHHKSFEDARNIQKSLPPEQIKYFENISQRLSQIRDSSKPKMEVYTEEERKSLVDTLCNNTRLFNVFFSGL